MTNMVSTLHFSTSSKEIIEYFTNLAGPVKSVAFCLNNCGIYNGQVKIIFHAPGDARKAVWSNNATEIRHHSFHERKKSVLSSYRGTSRIYYTLYKVIVSNLHYDATIRDIEDHFGPIGKNLLNAYIYCDSNGKSVGKADLFFCSHTAAKKSCSKPFLYPRSSNTSVCFIDCIGQ